MNISKRIITLPDIYWDEIDKSKDGLLIRSHSDAVISIMNKICPELIQKTRQSISKTQPNDNQLDILNTPSQFDVCFCSHPRNTHNGVKCIAKGCACEAFEIDVETTRRTRAKTKAESL